MDSAPFHQHRVSMGLNLGHDPAHIGLADPNNPIKLKPIWAGQIHFRLSTLTKDMNMGGFVIIRENHKTKTKRPMDCNH
jgi:hypothetical protein